MLRLYRDEPFMERISTLIDRNPHLWNKAIQMKHRQLPIQSHRQAKGRWNKNIIILITSDSCREIYDFILKEFGIMGVVCCRYPQNYFTYTRLVQILFQRLPLKRQILFSAGNEPHENALAVVEYLEHSYQGRPYRVVFLGKTTRKLHCGRVHILYLDPDTLRRKDSLYRVLRFCWLYSVSGALLYENQPLSKKNRRQKLIFLNHGTVPMKDVHDVLKQPETIDYALCPSIGCSGLYRQQYGIPAEKLIYAMPPRDSFLKKSLHRIDRIVRYRDRQIILWLPTFRTLKGSKRKDSDVEDALSLISGEGNLSMVNKRLQDNGQILLIKYHPGELSQAQIPSSCGCIQILTEEELGKADLVLQEIMGDTAALLTDYSGISFEYLLLDNPIGYVVNDIGSYIRGFAVEPLEDYMPGAMIGKIDELLAFLDDVRDGRDIFREARKRLAESLFQGNDAGGGSRELLRKLDSLN